MTANAFHNEQITPLSWQRVQNDEIIAITREEKEISDDVDGILFFLTPTHTRFPLLLSNHNTLLMQAQTISKSLYIFSLCKSVFSSSPGKMFLRLST